MAHTLKPKRVLIGIATAAVLFLNGCGSPKPVEGRVDLGVSPKPPYSLGAGSDALPAQTVEVRKGDTLHGLSLTHHVSVRAIMEANGLTSTKILPGRKLVIPAS